MPVKRFSTGLLRIGLAMARRGLRQRRLYRNARRAVCTRLGTWDRSVGGAARIRAHAARVARRTVSSGRCDGVAVRRRHLRRRRDAAGDFLRAGPGQGRGRNGARGLPGRHRHGLRVGHAGGGFPYDALQVEMRGLGVAVPPPPSPDASRIEAMRDLWTGAGLADVETREITVQRTFADFDDYWTTILGGPSVGPWLAAMAPTISRSQSADARAPAGGCRWSNHL